MDKNISKRCRPLVNLKRPRPLEVFDNSHFKVQRVLPMLRGGTTVDRVPPPNIPDTPASPDRQYNEDNGFTPRSPDNSEDEAIRRILLNINSSSSSSTTSSLSSDTEGDEDEQQRPPSPTISLSSEERSRSVVVVNDTEEIQYVSDDDDDDDDDDEI